MRHLLITLALSGLACACSPTIDQRKEELRKAAEAAVRQKLRDPQSAIFSDLKIYLEDGSVCGRVNSKNGFGGYAGPEYFAYHNEVAAVGTDDPQLLPFMKQCTYAAEKAAENAGLAKS